MGVRKPVRPTQNMLVLTSQPPLPERDVFTPGKSSTLKRSKSAWGLSIDICERSASLSWAHRSQKKHIETFSLLMKILTRWFSAAFSLLLFPAAVFGSNLLVNPSFEQNSGRAVPTGWTRFAPPNAQTPPNLWIEAKVPPQSGSLYFKEWGASYSAQPTNIAGIYQDLSSAPGSTYQASGWFYTDTGNETLGPDCYVWIEISFLGGSSNLLALYKSEKFSSSTAIGAWTQLQVDQACDVSRPIATGDPYFTTYAVTGTVSQIVAPVGAATVRYRFAYAQLNAEGGSCYFDSAVLNQISGPVPPVISNVFPRNMIFVNPADGITFNVSSPSGYTINNAAISLVVNGVNVSSGLSINGTASSKTVAYHGLQSNTVYTASMTVTDAFNLTASANTYFETTWVGTPPILYLWEAEDFDFGGGQYFNNPSLCNTPGSANCYFGTVGVEGVDEHVAGTATTHVYRPDDAVGTVISGDYARKDHDLAGVFDYRIDPFVGNMWLNYTRNWSNGTYWVIGRLSTDVPLNGSLTLSIVNPDTTTTDLGTFTINGGKGWSTFENVFLKDTNGNLAAVTLSGKQTLRVTSGGNLLPNFFALVAGQVDLPTLSNVYPTGKQPFEFTNAFSFTVTAVGSSFPAGGIKLILDGADVSAGLQITGSGATRNVVYPLLLPNAIHTAVITATNALGHGIASTNTFDTFSQDNYMVEAEDFDFGGGQYIAALDWYPDAYANLSSITNIDFQHSPIADEKFPYRPDGIPQETAYEVPLREQFQGFADYHLAWFGPGDWANYTRMYPTNTFYVYTRSAGYGAFAMGLDHVVTGAGTTNQTTRHLGTFGGVGRDNQTHRWVPLTDDALGAPVPVKLNGLATLRLSTSTGNCYPSYFMLVPAVGMNVSAAAAANGTNVVISFPTQNGVVYRVFYRNDLASGSWILLTSVAGDGTVKSISDPVTAATRFYKIVAP